MLRVFSIKKKDYDFILCDSNGRKIATWKVNPIKNPEGTVSDQETLESILNYLQKQNKKCEIITVYPMTYGYEIITRE